MVFASKDFINTVFFWLDSGESRVYDIERLFTATSYPAVYSRFSCSTTIGGGSA
jgi:hypothetical protein